MGKSIAVGMNQNYHKDVCPCGGKPQKKSPQLVARQAAWDGIGNKEIRRANGMQDNKPGSQNRKKG